MIRGILFLSCLSVCLCVANFNLCYNFSTIRDRDFIFGMHTPLMMPLQMTPKVNDLVTFTLTLKLKIAFSTCCRQGYTVVFHKYPLMFVSALCRIAYIDRLVKCLFPSLCLSVHLFVCLSACLVGTLLWLSHFAMKVTADDMFLEHSKSYILWNVETKEGEWAPDA